MLRKQRNGKIGKPADGDAASTGAPSLLRTGSPTGETIYGDRSLRFRTLTLTPAHFDPSQDPSALHGGFKIRVAVGTGGKRRAGTLIEKRYTSRGYAIPAAASDLSTFLAYDEGTLVGTVSVRLDHEKSKDRLSADSLYKDEIDKLRAAACRVCEFTRLAVDRTVASKPVLAGLFHTAYLYAAVLRSYTHGVIEVNPRHVVFYRKALGFVPIGVERLNERVNAPAVLLAVSFADIAAGLRRYGGKRDVSVAGRSLFPYGFSPSEELGILGRLRGLV